MKCVLPHGSTVCEKCQQYGKPCLFDTKTITERRYQTNKPRKRKTKSEPTSVPPAVPSPVLPSPPSSDLSKQPTTDNLEIIPAMFRQWNYGVQNSRRGSESTVDPQSQDSDENLISLYRSTIETETPFLSRASQTAHNIDRAAEWCLKLAANESPCRILGICGAPALCEFDRWTPTAFSCFFLTPLRVPIPSEEIAAVFRYFNREIASHPALMTDVNMLAGACTVDAWNSLSRKVPLQTRIDPNLVRVFAGTLNDTMFNYNVVTVCLMLYELLAVLSDGADSADPVAFWDANRRKMLIFEYEMLVFPVKLTPELSVIDDSLQATSEALFLHIVHNTLMIVYYGTAVLKQHDFGRSVSIYAIPGLYLFIAGMAKSNFTLASILMDRWGFMADCMVITARYILALHKAMPFDNFKEGLFCFRKNVSDKVLAIAEAHVLLKEIDTLLEGYRYTQNITDGAAVFWVFRDTRSMTLDVCLGCNGSEYAAVPAHVSSQFS